MLESKGDAEFVGFGVGRRLLEAADEMEAGEVLRVIFDPAQKDIGAVFPSGEFRREAGDVLQRLLHDVLDASRRVIKRQSARLREAFQKLAALIEGDWVREHGADGRQLNSRRGNEVVANLQQTFGVDTHRILEQQIVMLGNCAVQCVLDGEYCTFCTAVEKSREDIGRYRTRQNFVFRCKLESSHVAVGATFSLDRDPARRWRCCRGSCLSTMCYLILQGWFLNCRYIYPFGTTSA